MLLPAHGTARGSCAPRLQTCSRAWEAIDKLLKCSEKCLDDMALYTLYKKENMTAVRRMNGRKAIEAQDNMGLELR